MSKRRIMLGVAAVLVFGCAGVCFAKTIVVNWDGSGDYTTIQAAIDAADANNVVVVADGTYAGEGSVTVTNCKKTMSAKSISRTIFERAGK